MAAIWLLSPVHALADKIAYSKIRAGLGVQKCIVSGGGALPPQTDDWRVRSRAAGPSGPPTHPLPHAQKWTWRAVLERCPVPCSHLTPAHTRLCLSPQVRGDRCDCPQRLRPHRDVPSHRVPPLLLQYPRLCWPSSPRRAPFRSRVAPGCSRTRTRRREPAPFLGPWWACYGDGSCPQASPTDAKTLDD